MESLAGKTAIVTGGSRGIGATIATHFAQEGVSKIAITYAGNIQAAEETLTKLRSLGVAKAIALQANLLDPTFGPDLIPKVLQGLETQKIDIIVNNAGINAGEYLQPTSRTTADIFGKMLQANAYAPLSLINAALPHLPEKGGRIINISSVSSKLANGDMYLTYGASKAALDSITRSLAANLGVQTGATFNSVSVGTTRTDVIQTMLDQYGDKLREQLSSAFTAEKRIGEAEDVAFVVGFLASDKSRWINGASIPANGGQKDLLALQG
ncbi:uncharacterized protein PV07_11285 [Cladophialophora immunda]|uniref:3-oxoacyl-[acyl-carrier-protein] reductase n=1 Tax=Cladophialophora immunda TaxID=569365 RepID=A0A0D2BVJ5_9EURO|nr:uncharacterized protein PV07_11285 [Cladophialophora immunda]KIW23053.1 hypothetical protein PV07_11285 [Cladophialophora immunda]OQU93648.1 hypothetical protein CLAIMM_00130 [Cladophialophora immunda]